VSTYLAILNPAAGGGRCGRSAPAVLDGLRAAGVALEVATTTGAGHATVLAREAYAKGRRWFIAIGGDGTAYEILNGVFPEASAPGQGVRLGFLPLGTGNSFLRDFTETGAEHARSALVANRTRKCDVLCLEHDAGALHFINLMSLGFVADVCAVTNRRFKRFGEAGYGLGVLWGLAALRPRPMPYTGAGDEVRDPLTFVSFCNSRFTGGKMMMAPRADCADGEVDVILARAMSRAGLLRTFPKIFKGTHFEHPAVSEERAREVGFDIEGPVDVMIDGEVVNVRPRALRVLPRALEVVI
jgi:diacylglycerol kinase (ATP)